MNSKFVREYDGCKWRSASFKDADPGRVALRQSAMLYWCCAVVDEGFSFLGNYTLGTVLCRIDALGSSQWRVRVMHALEALLMKLRLLRNSCS